FLHPLPGDVVVGAPALEFDRPHPAVRPAVVQRLAVDAEYRLERLPLRIPLLDEDVHLRYLLADLDEFDRPVPGAGAGSRRHDSISLDGHGDARIAYPGAFPLRQFLPGSGRTDAGGNGLDDLLGTASDFGIIRGGRRLPQGTQGRLADGVQCLT